MSILAGLTKTNDIQDGDRDVLGGFSLPETGAYDFTIKYAYLKTATSGAIAVEVVMETEGYTHNESFWVQSGAAKGGNNYYVNAKGEKKYLPGFILADTLCELVTGKGLAQQDVQEKVLNLYNYEAGKEVPTTVPVLMGLVGQKVKAGVIRVKENKRQKDDFGNYVDTPETREFLEVDKFFAESGHTLTEMKGGAEPAFIERWKARWEGQERDKRTIKDGAAPQATPKVGGFQSQAAAPAAQPAKTAAATSLFG